MLDYPEECIQWIRPYYSVISEWNKSFTAKVFSNTTKENKEDIILVITDIYCMCIDNPDVKLIVQWDLFLSFDFMIQRIGRARKKSGILTFILLTPK